MRTALFKIVTSSLLILAAPNLAAQQSSNLSNIQKAAMIEAKLLANPQWLADQAQLLFLKKSLAAGIAAAYVTLASSLPENVSQKLLERAETSIAESLKTGLTKSVTGYDVIGIGLGVAANALNAGIREVYGAEHPYKVELYIAGVKGLEVLYAGLTKGVASAVAKESVITAENLIEIFKQARLLAKDYAQEAESYKQLGELADRAREEIKKNRQEAIAYKETDALSSSGRPKVIDTTTNYFAVATVFSPSSGSAHLLTATGFQMRRDVSNTSASYDTGSGYSGSIGTASVVDQGSDASGGNLNWGRWSGAGSTNVAAGITYTGQNFHYVYGSAPTNIPSSGSVTYNPVGGTNPTSSGGTNVAAGTAGTFNGGTIGVNFATRAVTISNLNFSVSTATFNMNGSSTYNSNALFVGSLTGTCTGAACSGAVSGNHIGTLTGPAAAGVALGYQAYTAGTGMVVGAQGFKR